MSVRELYALTSEASDFERDQIDIVQVQGWVRTNRAGKNVSFIALNDGTFFKNVQIVYSSDSLHDYDKVSKYLTGTAISVIGKYVPTPEARQPFEIQATEINLEGACDGTYPMQKKRHSFEYLREVGHLRPRTNTFAAVFRVRSCLAMAIHQFFQEQGFVYVHTPIITGNDAEGAGETFTVTTRDDANYEEDFFGKHASLTVSGQLQGEAFAMAFRDIYTFGPTFRAENSNTTTHAAEFWMIEPEMAFADLAYDMDVIEDMIKYCIDYVLETCPEEMEFFNERIDTTLLERLNHVRNSDFRRMTYTEAIEILKNADVKFENNKIEWGMDLNTEHERYITEKYVKGPTFLIDYPEESKAFYDVWNLYVGGIHVDGSNYKDILGDGKVNFDPENANFSHVAPSQIFISQIIQKTHIELDREGTKAAAVTAVVLCEACIEEPIQVKEVRLDRPFVYMIVDTATETPVFIGSVNSVNG